MDIKTLQMLFKLDPNIKCQCGNPFEFQKVITFNDYHAILEGVNNRSLYQVIYDFDKKQMHRDHRICFYTPNEPHIKNVFSLLSAESSSVIEKSYI